MIPPLSRNQYPYNDLSFKIYPYKPSILKSSSSYPSHGSFDVHPPLLIQQNVCSNIADPISTFKCHQCCMCYPKLN